MRKAITGMLFAALLAASVQASDFSALGHPATARSVLLDPMNERMVRCVAVWSARGERAGLAPLADEIVARTGILIGFPAITRDAMRFPPEPNWSEEASLLAADKEERDFVRAHRPKPMTAAEQAVQDAADAAVDAAATAQVEATTPPPLPPALPAECNALAETYRSKGAAAAIAMLGPAPTTPIGLPTVGSCLAAFDSSKDPDFEMLAGELLGPKSRLDAAEEARITADRAVARASGKLVVPVRVGSERTMNLADEQDREMAMFFCFGPVLEARARAADEGPRYDDPQSWPRLRLFSMIDERIEELDRLAVEHPDKLSEPVFRALVGLPEWALPPRR